MTKKETLTESMRRLSNIVDEAEQVNELDFNPRKIAKDAAGALGSLAANIIKRHFKAAEKRRVAGSTIRQYENIQDLAKSLARELGDDPKQWSGQLNDYFAGLRQGVIDEIYQSNLAKGDYRYPDHAHRRMNLVMDKFDDELKEIVKVTARYAQDPYDVEMKAFFTRTATRTAKSVLEKIRNERPAARTLPANHLTALYKDLAKKIDDNVFQDIVKKFLLGFMAFVTLAVLATSEEGPGPQED